MKRKTANSSYTKILREIQHDNVSLDILLQFRDKNPEIPWTDLVYSQTGDTILHIAARLGEETIVNYIVKHWHPLNIDVRNHDSKTPLHEASQFSQSKVVEILLKNGAQPDALKKADWTPLMLACTKTGAVETTSILLKNGANPLVVNKDGWNSLHLSCRTGDLNLVQLLLNYSNLANSNGEFSDIKTRNGRSILHIASLHGNFSVVDFLLREYKLDVNVSDTCGNTPFHEAVCSGNEDLVRLLVSKSADVNQVNNAGLTGLHLAAGEGLIKMLKFLVRELKMGPNFGAGVTPLHCAARRRKVDAMDVLVELGADPKIADDHGRLPANYLTV